VLIGCEQGTETTDSAISKSGEDVEMNHVENLLIPTREEAQKMINQPFDPNNPPVPGGTSNDIIPNNYDLELAIEKGLATSEGFSDLYLNMQALYRKALEQYLSERLNLGMFDEMLISDELRFIPRSDEGMSFHQRYSTFGFSFIYLRNNLPIERLSEGDLEVLRNYINDGSSEVTEPLLELVARTYARVISVHDEDDSGEGGGLAYYCNRPNCGAPNDALVFEIDQIAEINESGRFTDRDNEIRKREYLVNEFIPLMEQILSEKLDRPVVVFLRR